MRVLYARVGVQHCPTCDRIVQRQSAQEIVQALIELPEGARYSLLAPLEAPSVSLLDALRDARKRGFVRARIDGTVQSLEDLPVLDARVPHRIELVVDRLVQKEGLRQRLTDSVETALRNGGGRLIVLAQDSLANKINPEGNDDEQESGIHEGADLEAAGLSKLIRKQSGERSGGFEDGPREPRAISDEHGDGHCLSHRAAQ